MASKKDVIEVLKDVRVLFSTRQSLMNIFDISQVVLRGTIYYAYYDLSVHTLAQRLYKKETGKDIFKDISDGEIYASIFLAYVTIMNSNDGFTIDIILDLSMDELAKFVQEISIIIDQFSKKSTHKVDAMSLIEDALRRANE